MSRFMSIESVADLRRWVAVFAVGVLLAIWLASETLAVERTNAVRLDTGLTVVPFAVPVATPVAVVQQAGVFYAYAPASGGDDAPLRAEFEAFKRWRRSQTESGSNASESARSDVPSPDKRVAAASLVSAHCVVCHRGPQAKGGVRLDGVLTNETRLAAIRAVVSGEMPKGKPLSADVLGELLLELSEVSSATSVRGSVQPSVQGE